MKLPDAMAMLRPGERILGGEPVGQRGAARAFILPAVSSKRAGSAVTAEERPRPDFRLGLIEVARFEQRIATWLPPC